MVGAAVETRAGPAISSQSSGTAAFAVVGRSTVPQRRRWECGDMVAMRCRHVRDGLPALSLFALRERQARDEYYALIAD